MLKIFQSDSSTKQKKRRRSTRGRKSKRKNKSGGSADSRIPPVFGPHGNGNGTHTYARKKSGKSSYKLPRIAPWKIIVTSFIIGICGVLYISHVFQTQQLLKEVKSLEQQYERVKRQHEQYELQYERMTGPRQIYDKAQQHGFVSGGPVEKVITIEE